jgi:hypothetical protein
MPWLPLANVKPIQFVDRKLLSKSHELWLLSPQLSNLFRVVRRGKILPNSERLACQFSKFRNKCTTVVGKYEQSVLYAMSSNDIIKQRSNDCFGDGVFNGY